MKKTAKNKKHKPNKLQMSAGIISHLKNEKYISIATSDWRGNPHVSTKIIFRVDRSCIYIVDNAIARTCNNIKRNRRVALSIINNETQISYRIYGLAKLLMSGKEYENLKDDFNKKKVKYATSRVVEGVRRGRKHRKFGLITSAPKAIIKISIQKVVQMDLSGSELEKQV